MTKAALALILVAVVFIATAADAANGSSGRRIVIFKEGTPDHAKVDIVVMSGSRWLRPLDIVNGASIRLPSENPAAALQILNSNPAVLEVHKDERFRLRDKVQPTSGGTSAAGGGGVGSAGAGGDGAGGDGAGGDGAGGDGAGGDGAGGDGAGGDGAGGDAQVRFVFPAPTPAMEFYPWGIDQVGLSLVHSSRVKGQGVTVAIFDTGIDRTHPDLAPSIIGGFNAIEEATDERDYRDDNGHGTGVAGIIAARTNGMGVIGGAPKAQIFAVKVLNNKGEGHTSDVVYALNELIKRPHIRVINMSFGSSIDWTPVFGPIFPEAVKRATAAGKIIIASRGNRAKCALPVSTGATATGAGGDGAGGDGAGGDGAGGDGAGGDGAGGDGAGGDGSGGTTLCGCSATAPVTSTGAGGDGAGGDGAGGDGAGGDGAGGDGAGGDGAGGDGTTFKFLWGCANEVKYPAAFPEVITVGATTSFGYVPMYSLSEDLDVVAPGGHGTNPVFTTNVGGGYGTIVGTSASAAHVTAAVALALSVDKDLTADQISRILKRTATPMLCGTFANPVPCGPDRQGAGQINVPAMLDAIRRLQ